METTIQLWEKSSAPTNNTDGIITVKLLTCDKPTRNSRVYPREEVEKAVAEYMKKPMPRLGYMDGGSFNHMDLERVSHEVIDMEVTESGSVVGQIRIYDTPLGSIAKQLIAEGLDVIAFSPIMTGCVDMSDGTVSNLTFHATTIIPAQG